MPTKRQSCGDKCERRVFESHPNCKQKQKKTTLEDTNKTSRCAFTYTINAKANAIGIKKCSAGILLVWKT